MAIYIVFDVETPNRANDRMSAIGITAIKDSKIVANYFSLVDPETHFDYFNTQLTGIDAEKVKGAPNFAELWKKIEPIMSKGILVAHNAVFDMSVLRSCLRSYGITWKPTVEYLCTVQIGRRILPDMRSLRYRPRSSSGRQRCPRLCGDTAQIHGKRCRYFVLHQEILSIIDNSESCYITALSFLPKSLRSTNFVYLKWYNKRI